MQQVARELRHQLKEQSSQIASRKMIVEKNIELQLQQTQKESSKAEKLLEDQLEVGPDCPSTPVQSALVLPPTKPTHTGVQT